jgi:hypothetical protein
MSVTSVSYFLSEVKAIYVGFQAYKTTINLIPEIPVLNSAINRMPKKKQGTSALLF